MSFLNKSDFGASVRLRQRAEEENKKREAMQLPTPTYTSGTSGTSRTESSAPTTTKPTDYSSTVKYLQDRGVKGASGILTKREWQVLQVQRIFHSTDIWSVWDYGEKAQLLMI